MKSSSLFFLLILLNFSLYAQIKKEKQVVKPVTKELKVEKNKKNIRLNEIQVIGSHNSFKKAIDPPLFQLLSKADSAMAEGLNYSHVPIKEQLSLGLCNLELDIYADEKGGKYSKPKGIDWVSNHPGATPFDPEKWMDKPGFKVFHIQEIDFRSNCLTLELCLLEIKSWSDSNPGHHPIFVTINARDQEIKRPGFTIPEKFTPEVFDQLDKVILQTLGSQKLLVPDQIRGKYATLNEAVLNHNWPTLEDAKGKFIFILDETNEKRSMYLQGHSSLQNRVLFTNSEPGTPEAAILIINDAIQELTKIQELVKAGYIIRTRADSNTTEARNNDRSAFDAACKSGAQIISTDYYQPSAHFQSGYQIRFDGGTYFRINPLKK